MSPDKLPWLLPRDVDHERIQGSRTSSDLTALIDRVFREHDAIPFDTLLAAVRYIRKELSDPGGSLKVDQIVHTEAGGNHVARYLLWRSMSLYDSKVTIGVGLEFQGILPMRGNPLDVSKNELDSWAAKYHPLVSYLSPGKPMSIILMPGESASLQNSLFQTYIVKLGWEHEFSPNYSGRLELKRRQNDGKWEFYLDSPVSWRAFRTLPRHPESSRIPLLKWHQPDGSAPAVSEFQFTPLRGSCMLQNAGEKTLAIELVDKLISISQTS